MKAIIVDDERIARRELRRLLGAHPEIEIIGEAGNGDEALDLIHKQEPDILFLDIEMPGMSGFDLLDCLRDVPDVIFTTAYDQHALKAFEVNARLPDEAHRTITACGRPREGAWPSYRIPRPDVSP